MRAIRGMPDILPGDAVHWRQVEAACTTLLESYGYGELRLPLLESTALFARSIGEVTDIVEKEMYSFEDRNGDSITLRPEGTASCVRAALQHNLLSAVPCRLWYGGPMFRYERPQKGRQRQFHQVGAELFGVSTPDAEAELLLMLARLWRELGISDRVRLELNTLGSPESRQRYRAGLVAYLTERSDALDEDSLRRLQANPLRILDSKVPETQALLDGAPHLEDCLDDASREHRDRLESLLAAAGVAFRRNPRLVRGLDYYNDTVFEWTTDALGAQGTVCAGGRYDGLVAQLGGRVTPAVGFAMGLERLVLLLQDEAPAAENPDLFAVAVGDAAMPAAFGGLEALRDRWPALRAQFSLGGGSFRSQLKRADRSGAAVALIWGDDEVATGTVTLKPLRGNGEQRCVDQACLEAELATLLSLK